MMTTHLAIDIGGSRGRVTLGYCNDGHWKFHFLGDFSTAPLEADGRLYWNVHKMFSSICKYIHQAASLVDCLDTIAIDTMGVAYALLDAQGNLISLPPYTRTPQNPEMIQTIVQHFSADGPYSITGLEQEKLNTLYYLKNQLQDKHQIQNEIHSFLMLSDLFNYWLTDRIESEYTIAATSNLWDISHNCWSEKIMDYLNLPQEVCPKVIFNPQPVGPLKDIFITRSSLQHTQVVHVNAHDTASACRYIQTMKGNNLFISAGTWGMIGSIEEKPVLSGQARLMKFANEGAPDHKIKLVNNAPCMSILQSCMSEWSFKKPFSWDNFLRQVNAETSHGIILDLYHPDLREKSHMPARIQQYCQERNLFVPQTPSEIALIIIESIASHFVLKYKELCQLTNRNYDQIIMVGGAAKNTVLLERMKLEISIPIITVTQEATTLGNLYSQREALTFSAN